MIVVGRKGESERETWEIEKRREEKREREIPKQHHEERHTTHVSSTT